MIEVPVCFMYVSLYYFVSFFCIIVEKLNLEAACNLIYRNRNILKFAPDRMETGRRYFLSIENVIDTL